MTLKTAKRKNLQPFRTAGFLAEKEGFEPSRPFRSLHDFQSCALDQLGDFSTSAIHFLFSSEQCYYNSHFPKVNPLFQKFSLFQQGPKWEKARLTARPFSVQFRDDVVHRVIHSDTQFVDALAHLGLGALPALDHHVRCRADHQAGAHTEPESGTHLHFSHSFSARW